MAESPIVVTCFSDVLCVWAYVTQRRLDELTAHFGERVLVTYRFCDVFGDAHGKLTRAWADRGGLAGYAAHVRGVAERFDHIEVCDATWAQDPPKSSLAAHVFLRAVGVVETNGECADGSFDRAIHAVRDAFFRRGENVASVATHKRLAGALNIPWSAVREAMDDGAAHAALASDLRAAREQSIQISPTLLFNEGRQRLTGNVGYRIIEANVSEILERPGHGKTWC